MPNSKRTGLKINGSRSLWSDESKFKCGIILTENRSKSSQHPKKRLEYPSRTWRTTPEDCLKKFQESFPKRDQAALKNKAGCMN